MRHDCWAVWPERGFLIQPDPLVSTRTALDGVITADALDHIESTAGDLPALLVSGRIHSILEKLPIVDFEPLAHELDRVDFRAVERLMQIYSYFASAFIYGAPGDPMHRLPAGVAVPLVQLAHMVERPPILSYSGYVLANWRRSCSTVPVEVDSIRLVQNFLGNRDEAWFILIHVDIEMRAAGALAGLMAAAQAAERHDVERLQAALFEIAESLGRMIHTFRRMPEQCDSNIYYEKVRPYIFGFNDVIYEGVNEFDGAPVSFRGQTGAQSTIVPALVSGLGLQHEQNMLTQHLAIMRDYMPKPHREFAAAMGHAPIRSIIEQHLGRAGLVEAYNETLRQLVEFRSLHYHYATEYIFKKVASPVGTGGTLFMDWLKQLIDESEAQYLHPTPHAASAPMR